MENPFKFGETVKDGMFCNRVKEVKKLQSAFRDGQNIILISPRRWGKSSLVKQAIHKYNGKHISVQIDLFGITSKEEFLEIYVRLILQATSSRFKDITRNVGGWIKNITPYISFTVVEGSDINIGVKLPRDAKHIDDILSLPQQIAVDKGIPVIICVDEFQKIIDWKDGKSFLEKLRAVWQHHSNVCYCLYGSKRHVMTEMFNKSSLPFFKFGEVIFLTKIDKSEWMKFILEAFNNSRKSISEPLIETLIDAVENHPYYIQWVCRIIWYNTTKSVTKEIVKESVEELLVSNSPLFQNQTYSLTSKQTNYLKALVNGENQFSSQRVLQEYNLGSQGNIKRIETALQQAEILLLGESAPEFSEPYFKPLFQRKYFLN